MTGPEPWARMGDRRVWRAVRGGLLLTVTRLAAGGWQALVEDDAHRVAGRSPVLMTRTAAQRWAEARATARDAEDTR